MSTEFPMASGDSFNFSDEPTTSSIYLPSSEPSSRAPVVDSSLMEVSHNNLFIDALGVKFQLTSEQKGDLQGLHQLATSLPGGLTKADIMARILSLACQYGSENRVLEALTAHGSGGGGNMKGVIDEINIRLGDNFATTKEQKANIRRACQELIYTPARVGFKTLHLDVEKKMRAQPSKYGMDNIFGQSSRERKWMMEAKRIASNVRNVFRQEIRDSILGDEQSSLSSFTFACAERFHREGAVSTGEQGYLIFNVLMRRIAFENKALLVEDEHEDENSDNEQPDDGPTTRKRKRVYPVGKRGRVPKGQDFWSKVDAWFREEIEARGNDYSSPAWKSFIDESMKMDKARFDKFSQKHSKSPTHLSFSTSGSSSPSTSTMSQDNQSSPFRPTPQAVSQPPAAVFGNYLTNFIQSQTNS